MLFVVVLYSVVNVFCFFLMLTFFVYFCRRIVVLCGVFYIGSNDCMCPFCRVLLILDFLAPALVFDDDSLVDSFATSWMSWF